MVSVLEGTPMSTAPSSSRAMKGLPDARRQQYRCEDGDGEPELARAEFLLHLSRFEAAMTVAMGRVPLVLNVGKEAT